MTTIKNKNKNKNNALAKRLQSIEKYVNTHKGDIKQKITYAAITPATTGAVYFLSSIAQGDTNDSRTGNVINLHHVAPHLNFQMTASCNVRIIVFRDKFNQGAIPNIAEVLDSVDTVAPLNYNNCVSQKRFVIIDDYVKHFTTGGVLYDTVMKTYNIETKVRYSGAAATAATCLGNNIFLGITTDTATPGTVALYSRLLFTDE